MSPRGVRSGSFKLIWVLVAAILAAGLSGPLLLTEIPPVLDYPNHLARAYLLAFGPGDPMLSRIYVPHWAIIPNLLLDLLLPPLLQSLPVHVAGRLALATSLFMPIVGLLVYNRVLFGRLTLWPLASALVAFNGAFLLGFMNFLFSVGGAFLTAAVWVRWRERAPAVTVLATAIGAVAVFFCHLVGLSLLLALIAAYELDRPLGSGRDDRKRLAARMLAAGVVFVPPLVLYSLSPTAKAAGPTLWLPIMSKPLLIMAPLMNYDFILDACNACFVIACICFAVGQRWLFVPRSGVIAIGLLLTAYLAAPFRLMGGAFFDYRFAIILGYLVFATSRESQGLPAGAAAGLFGSMLMLFCVRLATLAGVWQSQATEVAEMQAALSIVPPGSRVLIATVTTKDAPTYWHSVPRVRSIDGLYVANVHLPVLLLVQRRAMPQTLFSDPSQQPIAVLPAYRDSTGSQAAWGVPSYSLLENGANDPEVLRMHPYLADWPSKFDFVVVVNAGGMADRPNFLAGRLALERSTEVAAVFRVRLPP
jgi:hypothetical protein